MLFPLLFRTGFYQIANHYQNQIQFFMIRFLSKHTNLYYTSNWKKMTRKRKLAVKKRPFSKKKLKQQSKVFNYAHQYKALQIRKLMDNKKQMNFHLDELMNELFYPDIRNKNYEAAAAGINGHNLDLNQNSDPIERLLNSALMATQLIQVHQSFAKLQQENQIAQENNENENNKTKNNENENNKTKNNENENTKTENTQNSMLFELKHYKLLFNRLQYYLQNLPIIKQKKNLQWKKSMQAVKEIKKKKPSNPLLFFDALDLPKYKKWRALLSRFRQIIENSNFQSLNLQIQTVLCLKAALKYLPEDVYKTVVDKILALYIEVKELSSQQLELLFDKQLKINILKLLSQKNNVKLYSLVVIQTPQNNYERQTLISQLVKELIYQIIQHPKAGIKDILTIIDISKINSNYLTKQILQKARFLFLTHLFNINFKSSQLLFQAHVAHQASHDILELLKFDLYRKVRNSQDKYALLQGLKIFNQRLISKTNLDGYDLFVKYCEAISSFVANGAYKPDQLLQILRSYFNNSLSYMSPLKILQNQLMKNFNHYSLEQLSEIQFMLWILQCPSKIVANKVLQRFLKSYKSQWKKYSEQDILQLPGNYETEPTAQQATEIVHRKLQNLQQYLILSLWCSSHDNGKQVLDNMLLLFPKKNKLITHQILCFELLEDISRRFSKYGLTQQFSTNLLVNKEPIIATKFNHFKKQNYVLTQIQKCLWDQLEFLRSSFKQEKNLRQIGNYLPGIDKYIEQKWSNPNSNNVINSKKYSRWVQKNPNQCFFTSFNKLKDLSINLPQQLINKRKKCATQYLSTILQNAQEQTLKNPEKQKAQYYKLNQ